MFTSKNVVASLVRNKWQLPMHAMRYQACTITNLQRASINTDAYARINGFSQRPAMTIQSTGFNSNTSMNLWTKQAMLLRSQLGANWLNAIYQNQSKGHQLMLINHNLRPFSAKTRKIEAKKLSSRRVKKYKLKTKKSLQKRVRIVGTLRARAFKYYAVGHRHLQRNKSRACLIRHRTKRHLLSTPGDIRSAKRQLPYFRKNKFLRC